MKILGCAGLLFAFLFLITTGYCEQKKYTRGLKTDRDAEWALDQFAVRYGKEHQMELVLVGDPTPSYQALYAILMRSSQRVSLQQGQIIATDFLKSFLHMLKTDEAILRNLQYMKENFPPHWQELKMKKVAFRIDFWDEKVDRIMPPYLAQIMLDDSCLYYYEGDPQTLKLQLVYKEPYEEALKRAVPEAPG